MMRPDIPPEGRPAARTAVLFSAGLDSAVLAVAEARRGPIQPVYVGVGLSWEHAERAQAAALLGHPVFGPDVRPLVDLRLPMEDVYPPTHWAIVGTPPAYETPDEDVYLVGRNVVLLTKAAVYAAQHGLGRIVLGPLAGNPFPDARPEFFAAMSRALSLGLDHAIAIEAPFSGLHKEDVIRLGVELGVPFELTVSCMNPFRGSGTPQGAVLVHCGACSKCRERQQAFTAAGVPDPTRYLARSTPASPSTG